MKARIRIKSSYKKNNYDKNTVMLVLLEIKK